MLPETAISRNWATIIWEKASCLSEPRLKIRNTSWHATSDSLLLDATELYWVAGRQKHPRSLIEKLKISFDRLPIGWDDTEEYLLLTPHSEPTPAGISEIISQLVK
jgi:hypothetical protein